MFNKAKFDDLKEKYKRFLKLNPAYDEGYKWTMLGAFEEHWNIGASDFATMYDNAIQQGSGQRLWSDRYGKDGPKTVMVEFAKLMPDITRDIFEDLFREESDIVLRMNRFVHHCDQMLDELQKQRPSANTHYHDDYRMLSWYLTLKYPHQYTPYEFQDFKGIMLALGAKTAPALKEIDRFYKVMRVFQKFLVEDTELVDIYKTKLEESGTTPEINQLFAHDFYRCCMNTAYQVNMY